MPPQPGSSPPPGGGPPPGGPPPGGLPPGGTPPLGGPPPVGGLVAPPPGGVGATGLPGVFAPDETVFPPAEEDTSFPTGPEGIRSGPEFRGDKAVRFHATPLEEPPLTWTV